MQIAPRVKAFLDAHRVAYQLMPHSRAASARGTAEAAHIPPERLAKAVLLNDDQGYLIALLPASRRLSLERVRAELGRKLEIASERELAAIFSDCETAAIPPFGAAYGIPTIVDEPLLHLSDAYFESGRADMLARLTGADFAALFAGQPHGDYGTSVARLNGPAESLRSNEQRHAHFSDDQTHVFSLAAFGAGLRSQTEYDRNGHTGMLLLKSPELRVVLEAMRPGTALGTHVVHGPVTLFVLEGALDVETERGTFRVGEAEMATLPREERREIRSPVESLFLLALARNGVRAKLDVQRRHILIVANQTVAGEHLIDEVRARIAAGPCEFAVLAPAVDARVTWRTEGAAREHQRLRVEQACAKLRELGAPVRATIGDIDPLRAIQDLLLVEPDGFDEIILSTLPAPISAWLKLDLAAQIARRFGIPVTHVAASD